MWASPSNGIWLEALNSSIHHIKQQQKKKVRIMTKIYTGEIQTPIIQMGLGWETSKGMDS